ncbi:MAG: 1,3-beta-galactosyl-N-acetylhexosamine phosphorylase [Oscillospiraceae bacterium]|nr:1,3-beta-galactosyl-N-acetylhexosamine phosphorylase [Oscillospiraceae bacterium]
MGKTKGGFTLPGESGYEELTLQMAEKWGADVIRDSDGTELSPEIVNAGYGIYSTICIIRNHNDWAKKNLDKLQETFLMTDPVVATDTTVSIDLMKDFFAEQFKVNDSEESKAYWQVFDRTSNTEIKDWDYADGVVTVKNVTPFHKYTVNFLAWRIWEEISMYNHTTNNWDKEHLMQIDPIYPETQKYMKEWLTEWCETHPATTVVRFTSMFYNFVWIWGSHERCRERYSDWASYDFTVSPLALKKFEEKFGYAMTSEDFINMGKLNSNHMACGQKKLDWMKFINDFVVDFGKELVDITHKYNKKAYVFYDDSWVGTEPWGERFKDFGFDGLIKCVFNGFETRLCAGCDAVETHEIRLHPYLFPTGLGGAPTFAPGGNPTLDAKAYWKQVRRALLRAKIDRIGLGGYLSLTIPFPDFQDYIEKISDEFRQIKEYHNAGAPLSLKPRVAVLTFWGKLRSWSCSGHYHEHPEVDLINVIEALSGLPLDVDFISFEDVKEKGLDAYDVVINAGFAGSAWSGGYKWTDDEVVAALTKFVYEGGAFIGVGEPSAVSGYDTYFRMAPVLGMDKDTGARISHGSYSFEVEYNDAIVSGTTIDPADNVYITDGDTKVIMEDNGKPTITTHKFGNGMGVYLSSFRHDEINNRTLLNLILTAAGESLDQLYVTDNALCECCYYPDGKQLVVINNAETEQTTTVKTEAGDQTVTLAAFDTAIIKL